MKTFGLTHQGLVRKKNEDRLLIHKLAENSVMLAVIDGLGGQPGGDVAAQIAHDSLLDFQLQTGPIKEQLLDLIERTNQAILSAAEKKTNLEYMGATVTAALIQGATVTWAHVGDCRIYHYRDNRLHQVTTDQNMAQFMVEEGQLTPEEAKDSPMQRLLDQCVGSPYCEPTTGRFEITAGDLLLLCTDGIHDELRAKVIADVFSSGTTLENRVEGLIQTALKAGGHDNITVVAAEI